MTDCACTQKAWFIGILHPEDEDNLVTYWNDCPIHTKSDNQQEMTIIQDEREEE